MATVANETKKYQTFRSYDLIKTLNKVNNTVVQYIQLQVINKHYDAACEAFQGNKNMWFYQKDFIKKIHNNCAGAACAWAGAACISGLPTTFPLLPPLPLEPLLPLDAGRTLGRCISFRIFITVPASGLVSFLYLSVIKYHLLWFKCNFVYHHVTSLYVLIICEPISIVIYHIIYLVCCETYKTVSVIILCICIFHVYNEITLMLPNVIIYW